MNRFAAMTLALFRVRLWGLAALAVTLALPASAQRGLPPAVRARSLGQGVRELSVQTGRWHYPAFLLSFNRNLAVPWDRLAAVPQGTAVDADLWVEPRDPEIDGLGSTFEGYRRQGQDVRVCLVRPRERAVGNASPARMASLTRVDWPYDQPCRRGLERSSIGPGALFAVEASNGGGYLVVITQMTASSIALRYFEYEFGD